MLVVEAGPGWGKTTAVRAAFPDAPYVEVPGGGRAGAFELALLTSLGLSVSDAGSIVARLDSDATCVLRAIIAAHTGQAIILDDIQRLDSVGSGLIEALVESQTVRLVLVGRSLSVLPIGTWVARGHVGMPFGPDVLALRSEHVAQLFSDVDGGDELQRAIVSTYAGWPLAASIATAILRSGSAQSAVPARLADGVAAIAGSIVAELDDDGRALLIESALRSTYGLRATTAGLAQIRRLALPESESGLHELFVVATLKEVPGEERARVAEHIFTPDDDPSALYALLAAEAPHTLNDRVWQLLAELHDRYDRATLQNIASQTDISPAAAGAARSFIHIFASRFDEAAAVAEPVLGEVARRSPHAALRLARGLVHAGRGEACVSLLQQMQDDDPAIAVRRDCLLGYVTGDSARIANASERASAAGDLNLIAFASIHASVLALHDGELDAAEGLAARGEDAARAAGSVLLEARALKIRYGIAMLRAKLDVAAVHVGRLVALQELVADPNERASDLVAAFEIEVLAGRPARAAGYDQTIRKIGHGWLDMETYVVCQAVVDAWQGLPFTGADRLAAFASVAQPAGRTASAFARRLSVRLGRRGRAGCRFSAALSGDTRGGRTVRTGALRDGGRIRCHRRMFARPPQLGRGASQSRSAHRVRRRLPERRASLRGRIERGCFYGHHARGRLCRHRHALRRKRPAERTRRAFAHGAIGAVVPGVRDGRAADRRPDRTLAAHDQESTALDHQQARSRKHR